MAGSTKEEKKSEPKFRTKEEIALAHSKRKQNDVSVNMLREKPSSKIELSGILYTDMEFIEVSDKEEELMAKVNDKKRVRIEPIILFWV